MGISREVVQRAGEQNILKEEDMAKPKKSKPVSTPLKQPKSRQSQSEPTSYMEKAVPPPKSQSTSSGGAKKRKKEKPTRKYVATEEENESDDGVREVKKTTRYARVVKKSPSSEAQPTKKPKTQSESSGKARARKNQKSKLDEAQNLELSSMIPKELYDILDAWRHKTRLEDERIKEYVLVNLSSIIFNDEVIRLLKLAKERFRSKKRVNKLMFGKIDEKEQTSEKTIPKEKARVHTTVDDVDGANDMYGEVVQDHPEIEVVSDKAVEETIDVDKDKDGDKYGDKYENAGEGTKDK
ncbi:uncharacterized protein LOC131041464 [Cryptomeria japonica]|uniref:uncharacterized protein LOC131041464 n=1 Tax=Cryptomeria japonica TaxID=3369 RepID=UPI0025ABB1FA|nr:uncharacterized protein LOC131041464 [Cryptomeria japonica]